MTVSHHMKKTMTMMTIISETNEEEEDITMESERSDFLETNSKGLSENNTMDSDIKLNGFKTEKN